MYNIRIGITGNMFYNHNRGRDYWLYNIQG